jgi:hypothetical protein
VASSKREGGGARVRVQDDKEKAGAPASSSGQAAPQDRTPQAFVTSDRQQQCGSLVHISLLSFVPAAPPLIRTPAGLRLAQPLHTMQPTTWQRSAVTNCAGTLHVMYGRLDDCVSQCDCIHLHTHCNGMVVEFARSIVDCGLHRSYCYQERPSRKTRRERYCNPNNITPLIDSQYIDSDDSEDRCTA